MRGGRWVFCLWVVDCVRGRGVRRTRLEVNEWNEKCVDEGWKDAWSLQKEVNVCVNEMDA